MNKHTPGPWEVEKPNANYPEQVKWSIYKNTEFEPRWLFDIEFIEHGNKEANAKLIAAAPELLEALKKIVEMNYQHAEDQYGDRNKANNWSCVRVALEAIKKAGGEL